MTFECIECTMLPYLLLFNGWAWNQMGKKCQYLAKKANFWPNLDVYRPNILIFLGVSKSFGTQITEKPPWHLDYIVFWWAMRPNGPKMPIFGTQKNNFEYILTS